MTSRSAGMHGVKQGFKRTKKRKREPGQDVPSGVSCSGPAVKQPKRANAGILQPSDFVKHALLAQYYPTILTLRQYVLASLPASSKIRRKKISAVGKTNQSAANETHPGVQESEKFPGHTRASLSRLLDTTLVATHVYPTAFGEPQPDGRLQRWIDYSQKGDDSHVTLSGDVASAIHCQTEVGSPKSCHWMRMEGHRYLLRHLVLQELTGTHR